MRILELRELGRAAKAPARDIPNQGVRFVVVGCATVCLDFGLLYVLTGWFGVWYFVSGALSFIVASTTNYLLSIRFVFVPGKFGKTAEFSLFLATSLMGLGINQVSMWLLVGLAKVDYLGAKLISVALVTFWNFVSKKKLVFIG